MRTGPCCRRPDERAPGSRARSVRACQVLRPRRVVQALAIAHSDVLPSATPTASAPRNSFLSRLNGWPARTPADASPTSSRMPAHGLGPMRFAIPSSQGTCTPYSLPVSRRTCMKALGISLVLEAAGNVVGLANEDDAAVGVVMTPPVCPQVEDVMEVDVRQQG